MKEQLRREIAQLKEGFAGKPDSTRIWKNLQQVPAFKGRRVFLYISHEEIEMRDLVRKIVQDHTAIIPQPGGDVIEVSSLEEYEKYLETLSGRRGKPEFDIAIISGVFFDRKGHRVGLGDPFFDDLLSRTKRPKIGVAFSFQVVDELPREVHGVKVDVMLTEKGEIKLT